MGVISLLAVSVLAIFGALVAFWLGSIIYRALAGEPLAITERFKFRSREKLIPLADSLIAREDWPAVVKVLRDGFYLEPVKYDTHLLEKLSNHHMGLLSRLLIVAERKSKHLQNIAIVEDLLLTRGELLRSSAEAFHGHRGLKAKSGKRIPDWALNEYRKKIAELEDRLETNRRSLVSQLDMVFDELLRSETPDSVTWH